MERKKILKKWQKEAKKKKKLHNFCPGQGPDFQPFSTVSGCRGALASGLVPSTSKPGMA